MDVTSPEIEKPKNYSGLDGGYTTHTEFPRRKELSTVDLLAVCQKLQAHQQHHIDASDTLSKHYSAVFSKTNESVPPLPRRRHVPLQPQYKVYIQYHDIKDTFVVRVQNNTLRDVLSRMPKRGNYRLFFKDSKNTCEEFEDLEAFVPYHEDGGIRKIYCHAFLR